ncbi:TPR repeat [Carpediemonas membranifera]|uniref:TPR repeat n=1 Tax=Carpediemonas membranifera TaxID=201153 RepID=A0A8J6AXX3_9EUKA|nr:TPR repeat [Carpediemonas membranifera]|eukprot:KAG9397561.1 TPR repeat [Carpediemonas membranifera]
MEGSDDEEWDHDAIMETLRRTRKEMDWDNRPWEEHPMFMQQMPEDIADNPELQAIQHMMYEDGTPESRAENFKEQGNKCVKRGKDFYKDAIIFYSEALDQNCENAELNSILYSNRAQVQILEKRYNWAVQDSKKALEVNKGNAKAWFRLAKSYNELGKHGEAADALTDAKEHISDARLDEEIKRSRRLETEVKVRLAREKAAREKQNAILAEALRIREIKMGLPILDISHYSNATTVGQDGQVHWSVLLVYPEVEQTDFLADVPENAQLSDIVEMVLEKPAEWDPDHKYKASDVFLAFMSDWSPTVTLAESLSLNSEEVQERQKAHREAGRAGGWLKAASGAMLCDVVSSPGYIVPTLPVFYVMRKKCDFTRKFLKKRTI